MVSFLIVYLGISTVVGAVSVSRAKNMKRYLIAHCEKCDDVDPIGVLNYIFLPSFAIYKMANK